MSKTSLDDRPKFKIGERAVYVGDADFPKGTTLIIKAVDLPEYMCVGPQGLSLWKRETDLVKTKEYDAREAA